MTAHDPTTAFLQILAGTGTDDRYLEIRSRSARGWRQEFFATSRLDALRQRVLWLGQRAHVYIGVVPRTARSGKKHALGRSHLIWCDLDHSDAAKRLATMRVKPVITVHSGTHGHLHAYFVLAEPLDVELLERANHALAEQLGGDHASTDAGRVLRIPGTLSFKREPPSPVRLASHNLRAEPVPVKEIAGELLPGPETAAPVPARVRPVTAVSTHAGEGLDRTKALKLIPAQEWVQVLLGVEAGRDGKITCPFHAGGKERTPSLQLYTDGHWFCYGCREGGSVLDFASRLWNLPTRDKSFNVLRDRLWEILGPHKPTSAGTPAPGATSEMALH